MHPQTTPTPNVSVITIAGGRSTHLTNVVLGLMQQTVAPHELIVGVMQDDLYELPEVNFPIRQLRIAHSGELPLALARNTVANAASGEVIAFVDVDCIPDVTLVADYARTAQRGRGVMMGEVLYLPKDASNLGWRYEDFERVAQKHSDRQGPPPGATELCTDYRCFWSLNFAMHAHDWARSGGFDEAYVGYGGEDTDYGRTLTERDIPIYWIRGGRVYHQYHPHAMPPIHHIESVLRNTNVFASKWGHRTMEHWLYAFREMGLIADTASGLKVIKQPSQSDYELCQQTGDQPYASTSRVLRILDERRTGLRLSDQEATASIRAAQKELLHGAAALTT